MHKPNPLLIAILLGAFLLMTQSLFTVDEREQVIVYQFGKPVEQYTEPGLKAKIPFIQTVRVFDKRVLDVDPLPQEVILADQKRIVVDTFTRYRITDMLEFSKSLQTEQQAATQLSSKISGILKSTLGTATLADLLSEKRGDIMASIRSQMNDSVKTNGIEIVDVRIGRADLPPQTSQSIFDRMRTEREREAAEFRAQGQEQAQEIKSKADKERTVLLAEAEKKAQISRGEGDELAIKVYADAYKRDPSFYSFYRTMEAYKQSLTGDTTTMILSPEGDFFRYFKNSNGSK